MGTTMPPDVRHSLLSRWVWNRVHDHNSSVNIIVVGGPGSGKSWTCTELGYLLDRGHKPGFNNRYSIKENVAMSDSDFKAMVAQKRAAGRVNQWEEIGVGAGARKWQSKENIETSQLFQIMRHNKGINLVNVPNKSMADKHVRSTSHILMVVKDHNRWFSWGKVYWISTDHLHEGERLFYKQLRFNSKSGKYQKMDSFICLPPPKAIRDEYEDKAEKWKKRYEEWIAEEARKRDFDEDDEEAGMRRVNEAVDKAKVLIETGEMATVGKNKIARAVLKYSLGLRGREITEAAQLIEQELASGGIQPGAARDVV